MLRKFLIVAVLVCCVAGMAACACNNPCNQPNPCNPCANPCNQPNPCNPCNQPNPCNPCG